jgi:nucleolin
MFQSSDDDEEDDDDDSSDDDSDDSGSDEEEEEEETTEAPAKKRKADVVDETPAKKARVEEQGGQAPTLFAGNLGWNVDDDALYEEFKDLPDLVGARVITDKATGRSRGFGYVDFANPEAAQKAYDAKNGQLLDGRDLRLDFAQKRSNTDESPAARSNDRAKKFGDVVSPESDTLFVGNLPFEADEESVSSFFSEVCNVKNLRLPTDQYVRPL